MNEDDSQQSPLQKYLAKHENAKPETKESKAHSPGESDQRPVEPSTQTPPSAQSIDDTKAIEAGAPAMPPPPPPPVSSPAPSIRSEEGEAASFEPGGFGVRFLAYMIDLLILSVATSLVHAVLEMALFFTPDFVSFTFSRFVGFGVIFFYYGWFYSEKGATPGKMVFDLSIVETGTGRRLGYWRTFFRETLGKSLSGLILGIGYLIAFFRADRKALHDLIFDTHVVRKKR